MPKQTSEFGRNWYAIHTYSGYEDAVARNLRQRADSMSMEDKIFQVIVPTEKRITIKAGKRKVIEEKIYPGYVLIDMIVTDDSWYVVRNTPRVTGFVGAGVIPSPLEKHEVDTLLGRMGEKEPRHKINVYKGDNVRIIDGPFKEMEGRVEEVDEERGKIKVLVSLFGRETPVELDPLQTKKL
jgi:transcription termination/antitermination protein NusG